VGVGAGASVGATGAVGLGAVRWATKLIASSSGFAVAGVLAMIGAD